VVEDGGGVLEADGGGAVVDELEILGGRAVHLWRR
jgi:hypothetical protein